MKSPCSECEKEICNHQAWCKAWRKHAKKLRDEREEKRDRKKEYDRVITKLHE